MIFDVDLQIAKNKLFQSWRGDLAIPPAYRSSVDVVFVHTPKTAGTSLRSALAMHMGSDVGWFQIDIDSDHLSGKKLLPPIRVLGGHFELGVAELLGAVPYTIFRDPIKRTKSQFEFILRTKTHPLYEQLQGLSFDKALDIGNLRKDLTNTQCRHMSADLAEEAIAQMVRHKCVFTTTDYANQMTRHILLRFGHTPAALQKLNVRGSKSYYDWLPEDDALIASMNNEDDRLYQVVQRAIIQSKSGPILRADNVWQNSKI